MKKASEIFIDLSSLLLDGDVLDIGYRGKGAIYRAISRKQVCDIFEETAATIDNNLAIEDFNWVSGNPAHFPFPDKSFDVLTAFFAFAYIDKRRSIMHTIKEIARTLRNNGRILIWDLNIKTLSVNVKRNIRVKLPGEEYLEVSMDYLRWPGAFNLEAMIPVLERFFIIKNRYEFSDYFYVEAVKKDDNN